MNLALEKFVTVLHFVTPFRDRAHALWKPRFSGPSGKSKVWQINVFGLTTSQRLKGLFTASLPIQDLEGLLGWIF
jgi:hypothetical protein